ncbi:MAG: hypothetical protein LBK72_08600, partial [Bifidobacteriaceae bacterium]|nr:hypothetical protein [Bifidobacteriaceae bacterium]
AAFGDAESLITSDHHHPDRVHPTGAPPHDIAGALPGWGPASSAWCAGAGGGGDGEARICLASAGGAVPDIPGPLPGAGAA